MVRTDPATRPFLMEHSLELFYADRFPGIEILLRERDDEIRYPEGRHQRLPFPLRFPAGRKPPASWCATAKFYLWSYDKTRAGDVTVMAPLTAEFLAELVPHLGRVDVTEEHSPRPPGRRPRDRPDSPPARPSRPRRALRRFDRDLSWYAILEADDWNHPGARHRRGDV